MRRARFVGSKRRLDPQGDPSRIRGSTRARRTLVLFGIVVYFLLTVPAQAQPQPVSFSVSPAEMEREVSAGETLAVPMTIINNSAQPLRFHAEPQDFAPAAWSMSVDVSPADFMIESGQSIILRVAATIPRDARGGRYAGVLVAGMPLPFSGTGVSIIPSILAKILVRVKGTEVISAAIQSIAARPAEGGAAVRVIFANRGNIHVRVSGRLIVLSAEGKGVVTERPLPEILLLPSSTQTFDEVFAELPAGSHVFRAVIDYGGDTLSIGNVRLP